MSSADKDRKYLKPGLLHLPGSNPETYSLVTRLLQDDIINHHAFWGKAGFHNHLPHHILAIYDLGAPADVIQEHYDNEAKSLSPITLVDRANGTVADKIDLTILQENWTDNLGLEKNYLPYLAFFEKELQRQSPVQCLEEYIFSPKANGNGNDMLLRVVGAAAHPLIQIGYGVEFDCLPILASGLAETAVTRPMAQELYSEEPGQAESSTFLEIIRDMYNSAALKPVMPYDPDALLRKRFEDVLKDGRPEAVRELACKWSISPDLTDEEISSRVEQALWTSTLMLAATGKPLRKPRLDFFLMHLLTSAFFLPTLMRAIRKVEDKARLLRAYASTFMLVMLIRGRPRIDAEMMMSYTATPRPRKAVKEEKSTNPWLPLVHSALHAPEAHVSKSIRALYYAAQKYGETEPGKMIGAFDKDGKEVMKGTAKLDGTIFVRAAGILMDALGWVGHGEPEGDWDRSALGWDDAWKDSD